ncbi:Coproporphyrinogen III oxidase [Candidatus Desulfarcum epimagneticum]|uniref:Coproporphyrinogen III oxidase n=1 Tax=uncultured Desulfobacteraceae bacterium TaxID=218296 RepID=A0A484HHR4_9BACT|nr:Coproporphyrinogen III oxidase [uncultured Desulfobacteraceae bacterium]
MSKKNVSFEQGPIRPPNEAGSLLIRLTRNCPWNMCLFCPVYKGKSFSLRPLDEIKQDISAAREIADDVRDLSKRMGSDGEITEAVLSAVLNDFEYGNAHRSMAFWLHNGDYSCFLQDADNLIMKTGDLVPALEFLKEQFPEISRITTYSRSRTVAKKSLESLKKIRKAGLDRVHIGLETGYDPLLKLMKKGVTGDGHVEAGRKLIEAGMELSEYVMPGLGGQGMWKEHAVETARVINRINPHFIRLRSLRIPGRIPLHEKVLSGEFVMQTDDMLAEEIKTFIQTLDGIESRVTSDHIMNLLEEVSGKLPEDKEKMLDVVEKYQALSDRDRLIYRVGRRGGAFRSIDDLHSHTEVYGKIEDLVSRTMEEGGPSGVEDLINGLADRYI